MQPCTRSAPDVHCWARRWPQVYANALEPGWVPTRMGGPGAPDDLDQAHRTQAWLAAGEDRRADVPGAYFDHLKCKAANPQALDLAWQDELLAQCAALSGVALPPPDPVRV